MVLVEQRFSNGGLLAQIRRQWCREQHCFFVLFASDPDTNTVFPSLIPPAGPGPGSEEANVFLLMILYISPKIIWKAFSTFMASSAEVSMKERPSFSAKLCASSEATARSLVANKHDYDIGVGMITKLLEPSADVLKARGLGHIINEKSAESSPIKRAKSEIPPWDSISSAIAIPGLGQRLSGNTNWPKQEKAESKVAGGDLHELAKASKMGRPGCRVQHAKAIEAKSGRLEIFRASSGRLKIFRARSGRLEIATFVFPSGRKHSSVSARAAVLGSILKGSVPEVDTAQYRNSVPLGTGTRYNWVPSWYRGVPSGYRAGTERIPRDTEWIPNPRMAAKVDAVEGEVEQIKSEIEERQIEAESWPLFPFVGSDGRRSEAECHRSEAECLPLHHMWMDRTQQATNGLGPRQGRTHEACGRFPPSPSLATLCLDAPGSKKLNGPLLLPLFPLSLYVKRGFRVRNHTAGFNEERRAQTSEIEEIEVVDFKSLIWKKDTIGMAFAGRRKRNIQLEWHLRVEERGKKSETKDSSQAIERRREGRKSSQAFQEENPQGRNRRANPGKLKSYPGNRIQQRKSKRHKEEEKTKQQAPPERLQRPKPRATKAQTDKGKQPLPCLHQFSPGGKNSSPNEFASDHSTLPLHYSDQKIMDGPSNQPSANPSPEPIDFQDEHDPFKPIAPDTQIQVAKNDSPQGSSTDPIQNDVKKKGSINTHGGKPNSTNQTQNRKPAAMVQHLGKKPKSQPRETEKLPRESDPAEKIEETQRRGKDQATSSTREAPKAQTESSKGPNRERQAALPCLHQIYS
ncbi:hypothetical protein M5K25_022634 [Dendrobium thyrsiflorum]|uniref:Uncharacterized protein n=1 Tax=Dendrobium thyrsiflorum TaxID=117978 RepID=A0ABD0U6M4_DENTH